MSKNTLIIALGLIPLILIIILIVAVLMQPKANEDNKEQTSPTPTISVIELNPEDTIRSFFNYLNNDEYEEAISLFSSRLSDEESDAYLESFKSWDSVRIVNLNKAAPLDEMNEPTYIVDFELQLKADSQNLIWQNGEQTRFITLSLENEKYLIIQIATSP
jgi:hypothetical protein